MCPGRAERLLGEAGQEEQMAHQPLKEEVKNTPHRRRWSREGSRECRK